MREIIYKLEKCKNPINYVKYTLDELLDMDDELYTDLVEMTRNIKGIKNVIIITSETICEHGKNIIQALDRELTGDTIIVSRLYAEMTFSNCHIFDDYNFKYMYSSDDFKCDLLIYLNEKDKLSNEVYEFCTLAMNIKNVYTDTSKNNILKYINKVNKMLMSNPNIKIDYLLSIEEVNETNDK